MVQEKEASGESENSDDIRDEGVLEGGLLMNLKMMTPRLSTPKFDMKVKVLRRLLSLS